LLKIIGVGSYNYSPEEDCDKNLAGGLPHIGRVATPIGGFKK